MTQSVIFPGNVYSNILMSYFYMHHIQMASPQCVFSDVLIEHIYFSKTLVTVIHKNSSSPDGVLWWFNRLILYWNTLFKIITWKWLLSVCICWNLNRSDFYYNYDTKRDFPWECVLKYFNELFLYASHTNGFFPVYILWYFNSRA